MTDFLDISREKWREVPAGGDLVGRIYSTDLLKSSDDALLEQWHAMDRAASDANHRGWYQTLYNEAFAGRRVIEVGSGLGFDGIYFMRTGARWIFTDIVKDNLTYVKRLVDLLGLSAQAEYLWIETPETLEGVTGTIDVVWANGSLHHAPFEIARKETQILLQRLTPGGRWIELFYPYERWLRQGKLPFSEFGKLTDGERTPWAEWYDAERVKQRLFPATTTTILDYRFGGGQYGWVDLRVDAPVRSHLSASEIEARHQTADILGLPTQTMSGQIKREGSALTFQCTIPIWHFVGRIELKASDFASRVPIDRSIRWAVDLEVSLSSGSAGFVLTGEDSLDFVSRELALDARSSPQRLTLVTDKPDPPKYLLIRNAAYDGTTSGVFNSGVLRVAA